MMITGFRHWYEVYLYYSVVRVARRAGENDKSRQQSGGSSASGSTRIVSALPWIDQVDTYYFLLGLWSVLVIGS
mgnify:CR=1 FL=1